MDETLGDPEPSKSTLPNDGRPWLMILVNQDGSIKVSGTVDDKILAYGLLSVARDAIKDSHDKTAKIERVNGSGGLIANLRRGLFK